MVDPVPDQDGDAAGRIGELLHELQRVAALLTEAPPGSLVRGWVMYVEAVDTDGAEWWDTFFPDGQPVSMTVGMADLCHQRLRQVASSVPEEGG